MSRFLGPIHYIVFNRIKAFEELESDIVEQIKKFCDADFSILLSQIYQEYGTPIEDQPLEDLIDTDNIHAWLQNRIDIAETRHAEVISKLLSACGEKSVDMMKSCYEEQGARAGEEAKNTKEVSTAPNLYQAVNFFLLDGMPCDQVNETIENQEDSFKWQVKQCLHKKYWHHTEGGINIFYKLRESWITQFILKANPKFTYRFEQQNIEGIPILVHEIVKK